MKFKCTCGEKFILKSKKDKEEVKRLKEAISRHLMRHFVIGEDYDVMGVYPCTYICTNCGKEFRKGVFKTKKRIRAEVKKHLSPTCNEIIPKVFIN